MTLQEFKDSIRNPIPPKSLSKNLQALWHDSNDNWDEAHNIVQATSGFDGDWIHAYLHRKEGDLSNASYWYSKVGKTHPNVSLKMEWEELANYLLTNQS